MAEVSGRCDERFGAVRDVFVHNLDEGLDLGASVAVYVDGEPVVDLWGGYLDAARTVPWLEDTIVNVWSTTKTMTALCALVLSDAGELDFGARVVRYWPEFGAAQKRDVEVRHLMGHTSGLAGWTVPVTVEDLYDWEKVTALLAAQEPWWTPGTASGYHALTQGYLVGELVRRITGQSVGRFFAAHVAGPLGADFFVGTPEAADSRVAQVVPPERLARLSEEDAPLALRTFLNPLLPAETSWSVPWRRAEIPAANGHGNARSVAAVHSVLACGGEARGVRLLSAAGCERVFEEQSDGRDLVLGVPIRFGMGFGLSGGLVPGGPVMVLGGGGGRLGRGGRPRHAHVRGVRHEQDGFGGRRRRPGCVAGGGGVRGPGVSSARSRRPAVRGATPPGGAAAGRHATLAARSPSVCRPVRWPGTRRRRGRW